MANPYRVQFVNDLHYNFPELLYNHQRFQNVGEVLSYITNTVAAHQPTFHYNQSDYLRFQSQQRHNHSYLMQRSQRQRIHAPGYSYYDVSEPSSPVIEQEEKEEPQLHISFVQPPALSINDLIRTIFGEPLDLSPVLVVPTEAHLRTNTVVSQALVESDDPCAICQDPIEALQNVRTITHCSHAFHKQCIDTWFQRNVHCPCCRHDVRV